MQAIAERGLQSGEGVKVSVLCRKAFNSIVLTMPISALQFGLVHAQSERITSPWIVLIDHFLDFTSSVRDLLRRRFLAPRKTNLARIAGALVYQEKCDVGPSLLGLCATNRIEHALPRTLHRHSNSRRKCAVRRKFHWVCRCAFHKFASD